MNHDQLILDIHYTPETGDFHWISARPKVQVGQKAGYVKKNKGYVYIEYKGKSYSAHRLAWFYIYKKFPQNQIDHINGNRADNRIANLREATHGQNRANSKHNNMNGLKGVCYRSHLKIKPWVAQITHNRKVIYLGCYPTKELAHAAYCEAAKKLHGEFFHG